MKKVLLLCAGHNDLGMLLALKKLGYYIIVTGSISGQPGEKYADRYIPMDYSDKEEILKIAREYKIDAICQCCNDFGVYTAAYVAEKMGLPGYDSYQVTEILHNKDKFKKFALENGIQTPISTAFQERDEAREWLRKQDRYPFIIKPVDASAGNGVTRIETFLEGEAAIEKAFASSRGGRVVIEPFVQGSQHGFCTFLKDRKVVACASNNEYSIKNPYRVEIDTFPADNYDAVKDCLVVQIEKMAKLLQLKDGIFHLQYIMDKEKPMIIEVMRRVLGNMYSVPADRLCGFDWDYWEVRAKCGLSCERFPVNNYQEGFFAYKTILAPSRGTIKDIRISEKYQKYTVEKFFVKAPGQDVENPQNNPVGFLFMQFSSMEEMKRVLIEEYDNDMVTMSS